MCNYQYISENLNNITYFIVTQKSNQENHHLKMQLEVAMKFQNSQGQELESMKDALQQMDEVNQQLKSLEEEQHRKELSHESEVTE